MLSLIKLLIKLRENTKKSKNEGNIKDNNLFYIMLVIKNLTISWETNFHDKSTS